MVGAYGAGAAGAGGAGAGGAGSARAALLPAPPAPAKAVIARPPARATNGAKDGDGPPITVFIGEPYTVVHSNIHA